MNRLKNYLTARSLANQFINVAISHLAKDNQRQAIHALIQALSQFITANNNLQSLAFGVKPKRRNPKP